MSEILKAGFAMSGQNPVPMNALSRRLLDAGCDLAHFKEFQTRLRESQVYSVDAFLERYPEFVDIGKMAIAGLLLPREAPERLYTEEDNWYRYLANKLVDNTSAGFGKPLVVLTYNYDRSLEHYLYRALKCSLHLNDMEMADIARSLIFIHLHGSLGRLPWQSEEFGGLSRDYNAAGDLTAVAQQIKIIHENVDDSVEYRHAREHLGDARRVCFLGFGFHRTNVRRLTFAGWPGDRANASLIVGTCLGLKDGEQRYCKALLKNSISLEDMDCLGLLRHHLFVIS